MLITSAQMEADKALYPKVKNWAAQLNLSIKNGTTPTFKTNGPVQLIARRRGDHSARQFPFLGDEEFSLSSVFLDRDQHKGGITMSLILCPSSLKLTKEISTVSVLMSEAIDVFSGLEAWIDLTSIEPKAAEPPGARAEALPTVEETRASEVWGAW